MTKEQLDHKTLGKGLKETAATAESIRAHVEECLPESHPATRWSRALSKAADELRFALDLEWYRGQARGTAPAQSPYFVEEGKAVAVGEKGTKTA